MAIQTVYVNGQPSPITIKTSAPGVVVVNSPSTSVVNVKKDFNVNLVDPELSFAPVINDFYMSDSDLTPLNFIEYGFQSSYSRLYLNIFNTAYMSGDIELQVQSLVGNNFNTVHLINEPSAGWGNSGIDQFFDYAFSFTAFDSQNNRTYRVKVRYEVSGAELFVYKTFSITSKVFVRFYESSLPLFSNLQNFIDGDDATLVGKDGNLDGIISFRPSLSTPYLYIAVPTQYNIDEAALSSSEFGISDFTSSLKLILTDQQYVLYTPSGPVVRSYNVYRVNQPYCFDGKRTIRFKISE